MPIRVTNIRLNIDEPEAELPGRLARILGLAPGAPLRWRILRKSLDARSRESLHFVYNAEVTLPEDEPRLLDRALRDSYSGAKWEKVGRNGLNSPVHPCFAVQQK